MEPGKQFSGVRMDRNEPIDGFTPEPGKAYRMLGQGGYDDLEAEGQLRSRNKDKYGSRVYFGDAPLKRYAARRASVDYFAEVPAEKAPVAANGYRTPTRPLMRNEVVVHQINRRTGEVRRLG